MHLFDFYGQAIQSKVVEERNWFAKTCQRQKQIIKQFKNDISWQINELETSINQAWMIQNFDL